MRSAKSGLRCAAPQAEIEVADDGEYHVAAVYRGEDIRLTDDFFITVVPDEKPVLEILEPARDWKATGIEEVMARFKAGDDFGLRSLELRYSVNGRRATEDRFRRRPRQEGVSRRPALPA